MAEGDLQIVKHDANDVCRKARLHSCKFHDEFMRLFMRIELRIGD